MAVDPHFTIKRGISMTPGFRKSGEFCWINMLTSHPAQARAFFGTLLGWTYVEMPGMGHRMQVDGLDIGGIFDLNGPNTPAGTSATIGVMVKVDSADAICQRVVELGGRSKPAFDIMNSGRMAVCSDSNGAQFDVWEPKKMLGTAVDSAQHGAPSWFETVTTDVDRATAFYTGLFGWESELMPMSDSTYTDFTLDGEAVAGMMAITPEMGGVSPRWGTYFTVDDVDAAAQTAAALGATLRVPVQEIPGVGRFCGITSPQGVEFSVITYA
jgi:predicted enzyme related to lactoylglutathione lyase